MNIRRTKKKKYPIVSKNEEELAKDKLFQISYYCDEKFIDQSNILTIEQGESSAFENKLTTAINTINKKKSRTLRVKTSQSPFLEHTVQRIHHEVKPSYKIENFIFNTLESNSVFVGKKIYPQTDKTTKMQKSGFLFLSKDKRLETMPNYYKTEKSISIQRTTTEQSFNHRFQTTKNKESIISMLKSFKNQFKRHKFQDLKHRLRRDLFFQ